MNNTALDRPIRVFVIAQPLLRWGFEQLLQTAAQPRCELTGAAAHALDVPPLLQRTAADVVVLASDGMPVEELADLCRACDAKVLLVTSSRDDAWLDRSVIAGVRGVVRTDNAPETLLKATQRVHLGELWIDRTATSRIFVEMARQKAADPDDPDHSRIATLTMRERQTIAAVARDAAAPGKVIADRLCISEHTLRNHLTSIYSKLGLCNRVDLYAYATRHRLNELR